VLRYLHETLLEMVCVAHLNYTDTNYAYYYIHKYLGIYTEIFVIEVNGCINGLLVVFTD